MPGVSNSSPLLYLATLGDLHFLPDLFGAITIPTAVWRETVIDGRGKPGAVEIEQARGRWLSVEPVLARELVDALTGADLEIGEAEAIALAVHLSLATVFMDDERGVQQARVQGLTVVRTPALFIAAKRRGWIDKVRPKLDQLRDAGFRLRESHYTMILEDAGEL